MPARHFEKKGAWGLFRRFEAVGSKLEGAVGQASERTKRFTIACRSKRAAEELAATWCRWALEAGFAEVPFAEGATFAIVYHLATPAGPGRARDDDGRNVYFAAGAIAGPPPRQGARVVLSEIVTRKRAAAPFMFGSKLEARRLEPVPAVAWSRAKALPDPPAKVRRALLPLLAEREDGTLGRVACGDLIFAYEKGVHRVLGVDATGDGERMVTTEPVLTSQLKRQSAPATFQVSKFCAPLPAALRRAVAEHYGL